MDRPAETFSLSTIRELFERRDDPYSGVYLEEPRRIGGVMLVAAGILTFPLALISPPTEAIGDAGWLVGGAINARSTSSRPFCCCAPGPGSASTGSWS